MRRIHHARRTVKCNVRMVPADSFDGQQLDKDYEIPTKGFCHECEAFVDEANGKLHRPTCKTTEDRRRAS